jgi:hypothetical protein
MKLTLAVLGVALFLANAFYAGVWLGMLTVRPGLSAAAIFALHGAAATYVLRRARKWWRSRA